MNREVEAKKCMPQAMRMAAKAYKTCGIASLTLEDFQDCALEAITKSLNKYDTGSTKSVSAYTWWYVKREFRVLRNKALTVRRGADEKMEEYDGEIGRDSQEAPIHLSDTIGRCDPKYEDMERLTDVFRYVKDNTDLQIMNGLLHGVSMENIGAALNITKQAVFVRFCQIRNKARAGLK